MTTDMPMIYTYKGRRLSELSHQECLDALEFCIRERNAEREGRESARRMWELTRQHRNGRLR